MKDTKKEIGRQGEELAADFLRQKGMEIVARNVYTPAGEIDIVARDGETTVFVEVKTRRSAAYGAAVEAITPRKLAAMQGSAEYYAAQHGLWDLPMRIDVVTIEWTKERYAIVHYPNILE